MKHPRVAGFFLVSMLIICIVGFFGASEAADQAAAGSSSKDPAVKAQTATIAPDLKLAAGDAILGVAGSALRPRESDVTFKVIGSGGGIYADTGDESEVFNTPLHLPQGTLVKSLRMYFSDTDPSIYCIAWFTVYDLNGNFVTEWAATSPTGNVGIGFADSSAINHTVDNTQYSYLLNWRPRVLGLTMQLLRLQLTHTLPPSASKAAVIPMN